MMLTEDGLTIMLREMRDTAKALGRSLASEVNLERKIERHQKTLVDVGIRMQRLENENKNLRERIKAWEHYADHMDEALKEIGKRRRIRYNFPAQPDRDIPF